MSENRAEPLLVIEPSRGRLAVNFREIWEYRELLWYLALRDLKVRYKQTALGVVWALLQPLATVLVFTIFFGKVAKIASDGLPYAVFSMSGLLSWNLFVGCLSRTSSGLLGQAGLISKVYFPRLIVPLAAVAVGAVDALLGLLVLFAVIALHGTAIGATVLLLPLVMVMAMACGLGFGLWISALSVRYRDLHHLMTFLTQLWLYVSPVIFPVGAVTSRLEFLGLPGWLYGLNPMAGIVAATRAVMFPGQPFPWELATLALVITVAVLVSGAYFFRRTEATVADII